MKVYTHDSGRPVLLGRCEIDEADLDHHEVYLFGATEVRIERYAIGEVTIFGKGAEYRVDKGIILMPGQDASLLPNWQPLSS